VKAFAIYKEASLPSRYLLFGHFTSSGEAAHAKGAQVGEALKQLDTLTMVDWTTVLEPNYVAGVGESIASIRH
jgi:hypothetical protein